MDARWLRCFVAVAEQLHFRRAAESLYLSQPTVTAHIQALERSLDQELFERGARRVRLTAAGERLLPYARSILALQAEAEVRAWGRRYDERLRICASIFVAAQTLPAALRQLLAERPRLDLALRTAFSAEVAQLVAGGQSDLGLARLPPEGPALAGRRLTQEAVVAVGPAALAGVPLEQALGDHPLLTHNHPGYWDRLLAALRGRVGLLRSMEVRQVDVTKRMLAEGLGLSFLPRSAVAAELEAGTLGLVRLPPDLTLPRVGTWAVWRRGGPPGEAACRLLELLVPA